MFPAPNRSSYIYTPHNGRNKGGVIAPEPYIHWLSTVMPSVDLAITEAVTAITETVTSLWLLRRSVAIVETISVTSLWLLRRYSQSEERFTRFLRSLPSSSRNNLRQRLLRFQRAANDVQVPTRPCCGRTHSIVNPGRRQAQNTAGIGAGDAYRQASLAESLTKQARDVVLGSGWARPVRWVVPSHQPWLGDATYRPRNAKGATL